MGALMALAAQAQPAPPMSVLSVAAAGFPVSHALAQWDAQAAALAAKATAEGALQASRDARELKMLLANLRNELQPVMEDRWDRLPAPQLALLHEAERSFRAAQASAGQSGRIDTPTTLDLSATLARLKFAAHTPLLRQVTGADLHDAHPGAWKVQLQSNLAALGATAYAVNLNGEQVPATWVQAGDSGEVLLTLPKQALAKHFNDLAASALSAELVAVLPRSGWKFWQSTVPTVRLPFDLLLYPRQIFSVTLSETQTIPVVDKGRTLVAAGQPQTVPGCGQAGCERDHNICNQVPAGSEALEPVFFSDSSAGDPSGQWLSDVSRTATGFCALFKQRSPQLQRQVNFDLRYHPVVLQQQQRTLALSPWQALADFLRTDAALPARAAAPGATSAPGAATAGTTGTADKPVTTGLAAPPGATGAATPTAPPLATVSTLAAGMDYGVALSQQAVSWQLTLKAFNGQGWVTRAVSDGGLPPWLQLSTSAVPLGSTAHANSPMAQVLHLRATLPWP